MVGPVNQHRHTGLTNARCSDTAEKNPFESTASVGRHGDESIFHSVHITAYRITSFAVKHVPVRLDLVPFLDFSSLSLKVRGFEDVA